LDGDLRRADDWIDHDRPSHWRQQLHEAEDGVHEAKLELERCLLMTTVDGQRPACREQKAALQQAKVRREYCHDKIGVVKKWQGAFSHSSMEFHGRVGQLRRVVEHDVPRARAVLAKILRHLDQYQLEKPPEALDPVLDQPASAEPTTRTPTRDDPAPGPVTAPLPAEPQ
jgi:hypothetical protein